MCYSLAADAVLLVHLLFILFATFGAVIVLRWPLVALVHLPAAVWAAGISFFGGICPLTPLENHLRRAGGEQGYEGGFMDHYVSALVYPSGLTRNIQIGLGLFVVLVNVFLYARLLLRRRKRDGEQRTR